MKKTLAEWASIAEMLGAAAIVISLVFVGLEIRGNTQVARAAAYERNIDSINQWRLELIKDPSLVRSLGNFFQTADQGATDAEVELFRLNLALNVVFGIYEKSYYANKYGIMAPGEWTRFERQACLSRGRALELDLWSSMAALLTEEFADHLASQCE